LPEPEPPSENGASELEMSAEEAYARAQAIDRAVADIYKSLDRELMAFARSRVETQADAEDLVQNVWLRALKRNAIAECGGDPKRIAAYLREAMRNAATDERRHTRSVQEKLKGYALSLLTRTTEAEAPDEHTISGEIDELLEQAIRKLPSRCREVFILVRRFDMSYAEVAKELDMDATTVAPHMRRAKLLLSRKFAALGYHVVPDAKGEGKEHRP
jgi:RNA polymerase sigma-70 factor (ECF subfamily)